MEDRFALAGQLIKLMKKGGINDPVAFSQAANLPVEQIQAQIAECKASDDGGNGQTVALATPVPTPEPAAVAEPKKAKKDKKGTRRSGSKKTKKTKKAEAAPEPTPEPTPAPVAPVAEAAPEAPAQQPSAPVFDQAKFVELMTEATAPLTQRVNKLEDEFQVVKNLVHTTADRCDSHIDTLRKEMESFKAKLESVSPGEFDLSEVDLGDFLDLVSRATGYACDIIEEGEGEGD